MGSFKTLAPFMFINARRKAENITATQLKPKAAFSLITKSFAIMSAAEQACTYATLILHDDGIAVTAEKIATLVNAANVLVESYWPSLFVKLAGKRNLDDLIMNVGTGSSGCAEPIAAAAAPAGGAKVAAPAAEEKKEEPKEESDDDMGFSLFD